MDPTYNGKNKEPRLLPARLPHLLIGGCNSLAPGYRGNIPPCPPEWVAESVTNVIAGKAVRMPKSLDHRWGGQLVSFDESWLDDGTGSASFVPRIKTEHGIVVLTSLAPRLSIDTVETRVQEDPAFAGLTEESSDSELVRIVIRVKRSHNVAEFAQRIRKACLTREHYFFLQISQRTGADGDVEYDPIIEGPRQFLTEWVKWRTSIVVGAARNRITNLKVEIARVDLLLRVIDHRREILRILDQSKSDDDIRNRTVSLLKCTMDQASEVMTIPWSRLARYKSAPLLDKRKHCIKNVTFNETIVSRPRRRLESDVSNAVVSIEESVAEAAYAASFKRTRTKRR
jgi:topoisomerase-4 subunit A